MSTLPPDRQPVRLGTVPTSSAQDGFALRRLGKAVAELLGADGQDAVRLATALSELGRDLLGTNRLATHFDIHHGPRPALGVTLEYHGGHPPSSDALEACARMLPTSHGDSVDGGWVRLEQQLPTPLEADAAGVAEARLLLGSHAGSTESDDGREQTRDLIAALERTRAQGEELKRLNEELAETNRGVVALYAELSEELEETNRGVVALYAELEEKSQQLREASEAKTRFWANVSHELRTPVNAVVGLAELLLTDTGAAPAEREQQLSLIADSGRTLLALVDELLDVAKAESGTLEPTWAPLDLRAVLAHLDGTLRGLARPGVVLTVAPPEDPGPIVGDETMLARILRNLLSNALKFTETGSVRLDARLDRPSGVGAPEHLVLTVADTGIGIPADQHGRVFEEFYQVRGPHQRGRHGTGLGLPYARRLVEILGGTMELESAPEAGTTITVRLPTGRAADPGLPARSAALVVVDDDAAFRALLRPLLAGVAERVVEVAESSGAVDTIRRERPDGVLLDLQMAGLDGYQVLAQLSADPDLRRLPVVVLTSAAPASLRRDLLTHARAVLPKTALTSGRLATALFADHPATAGGSATPTPPASAVPPQEHP
ncbi:hybrid sensor histidine kinase/response regulator [Kitasatospora sp. MMS16-BH015]|uniref:ATP-binding response regulator n=1 Tax=Kitasatospora sp. MMS16-BH015 TaxID=2018025 RepID=UPI000CA191D7|nr:ATP-binding protein [Kitasatospora sp. MMS16-BH015]AUG75309.1 hybrid sensor histidine kinase/response regulator [Kitasatospora sp. MMS16-BH015]